ncbi:molybdenum cofactor guanylyltransferase [Shouchella shacheensis]|uniref:molybdenum cofactor guanylyltransferase n=1 Tax=Shouchella shacheensis TaxID=1649580 RepID=UPI0007402C09|nr:molybdenum cofactor guanylyltransferase [Shouchella shacheensis]
MKKEVVGVVLAGGESRRFGKPKAFARYRGKLLYERAVASLTPHVSQVIVVSHPELTSCFPKQDKVSVVEDIEPYKGKGPLAGLYAAMKTTPAHWYIVLACDMPLMDAATVGKIAAQRDGAHQAVVPHVQSRLQPLAAVYHQETVVQLERQLASGDYRMNQFLDRVKAKHLTEHDLHVPIDTFCNVNDQEAFRSLLSEETLLPSDFQRKEKG